MFRLLVTQSRYGRPQSGLVEVEMVPERRIERPRETRLLDKAYALKPILGITSTCHAARPPRVDGKALWRTCLALERKPGSYRSDIHIAERIQSLVIIATIVLEVTAYMCSMKIKSRPFQRTTNCLSNQFGFHAVLEE